MKLPQILSRERSLLILIFLGLFLFFFQITRIPLFDGDACMYTEIAKNILKSGNWLTMQWMPGEVFDKPPLVMWLNAVFFAIFGVGHFAANLWHSALALLTVLITYLIGKELFDERSAFYSGIVLTTAGLFFYLSRVSMGDIPLTFFTALCFWLYILWERKGNYLYYLLNAVALGVSVLVKGPVTVLFVVPTILAYHLTVKRFPNLPRLVLATIVFLAAALPWFVIEYRILGRAFLNVYTEANVGRFFHPTFGATRHYRLDFYHFLPQLLVTFIPWAGFIGPSIYHLVRGLRFGYIEHRGAKFVLCWIVVIFTICSVSGNYKIIRYLLPLTPALALAIGKMWADLPPLLTRISHWTNLIIVTPLILLSIYLLTVSFPTEYQPFLPLAIPLVASLTIAIIVGSILGLLRKHQLSFRIIVIFTVFSYSILLFQAGTMLNTVMPIFKLTNYLNSIVLPTDRVGLAAEIYGDSFIRFYLKNDVEYIPDNAALIKSLREQRRFYYITEERELAKTIHWTLQLVTDEAKFVYRNR